MASWGLNPSLGGRGATVGYRGNDPQIFGCQGCGGAWVDRSTLNAIIDEAQAQAHNTDDQAVPRQTMAMVDVVIYRPCPRCDLRMNRRNFGRYSGIVVDECHGCGTFFDAGELEGVVAFVRGGGLGLTERRDARARQQRREPPVPLVRYQASPGFEQIGWDGSSLVLVIGLLRWLGRWIRKHRSGR